MPPFFCTSSNARCKDWWKLRGYPRSHSAGKIVESDKNMRNCHLWYRYISQQWLSGYTQVGRFSRGRCSCVIQLDVVCFSCVLQEVQSVSGHVVGDIDVSLMVCTCANTIGLPLQLLCPHVLQITFSTL